LRKIYLVITALVLWIVFTSLTQAQYISTANGTANSYIQSLIKADLDSLIKLQAVGSSGSFSGTVTSDSTAQHWSNLLLGYILNKAYHDTSNAAILDTAIARISLTLQELSKKPNSNISGFATSIKQDTALNWFTNILTELSKKPNSNIANYTRSDSATAQTALVLQELSSIKSDMDNLNIVDICLVDTALNDTCTLFTQHSVSVASLGLVHWYSYCIYSDSGYYFSNKWGFAVPVGILSAQAPAWSSFTSGELSPTQFPTIYYMKSSGYAGTQNIFLKIWGR